MHPSSVLSLVTFSLITNALPNSVGLSRRQDIDFDLVDDTADPLKSPTDTRNYNQASALAAVISDINSDPLPQQETQSANLASRDIVVTTIDGYTPNTFLDSAAINAPLGCNKADTYMGVKLFNTGPFDTTLCAAACTAQTKYNLKHPPSTGKAATCQFYNTYEMYRNDVYQGQYCTLYTQAWDTTYATNKGQWRGTAHYTIGRSYIASNVTDDGVVVCSSNVPSSTSSSASSTASPSSTILTSSSSSASSASSPSMSSSVSMSTSGSSVSSSSSSTTSSAPGCTFSPAIATQQQIKDSAALDFLFSHNNLSSMLSSLSYRQLTETALTGDILPSVQIALQDVVSCDQYMVSTQLKACTGSTYAQQFTSCIIAQTNPGFLKRRGANSATPTAALTYFLGRCKDILSQNAVTLSPDMSPIEIIDRTTPGGYSQNLCFIMMQYYFGEGTRLPLYC
ncbi:hypothetical protein AUEXF2481DRAFT_362462 [Aureobasidium subglaciale EXF-2481]|uniref:Apple domain-containing protein n=1 Tax=Aureobasidium subglaciale (strain EXF-2481) TaxID=1043005 RepID=A0A074Y4Y1_AURSE|nr:uncharacterized protein AUEXF2481DRAFT_362462 [Aureobasidium subglaciale EXF-2481]KEQ92848.1 hypothetical protein AUEXF2481DRAFT_362462 [Aureobasidium subglaciale EXF-2481]